MIGEAVIVCGAYLLGSLPTALLVVRKATGKDVRRLGSGNVGATNALRSAGWTAGIVVTVIDVVKGALPVALMAWYDPAGRWLSAAMVAAVIGHCFPFWLRFRGGKGVATAIGAFAVLATRLALLCVLVWLVVLLVSRLVSLASLLATVAFPVLLVLLASPGLGILVGASLVAVLVVVRHISNIRQIAAGTEPRVGSGWGV